MSRFVPPINPTNPEQRSILKVLNCLNSDGLLELMSLLQVRHYMLLKAMSMSDDHPAAPGPDIRVASSLGVESEWPIPVAPNLMTLPNGMRSNVDEDRQRIPLLFCRQP